MKNDIEKLNKIKKDLIFEKTELEKKIIEENQVNKTEKESKDEELKRVREYHSIKDFYKVYEDKKINYKKSYQKLKETKERLFVDKNVNNWGIDKEDLDNKILLFK